MKIHNLGFPRIGARRELKKALESYWKGQSTLEDLQKVAGSIRKTNWRCQSFLDYIPVGDFSFYDHILDMSLLLGNIPERSLRTKGSDFDYYFRTARGRSVLDEGERGVQASEMTKWFDTNYHYIVPEFSADTTFSLNSKQFMEEVDEALSQGYSVKPVLIGPVSYLYLGKSTDGSDKTALLDTLLPVYGELLNLLASRNIEWIQLDEPILVTDLDDRYKDMLRRAYRTLTGAGPKLLLTGYFGEMEENLDLALSLPVGGLHIDGVRGEKEIIRAYQGLSDSKVLSLGMIDGRNIWKSDLHEILDIIEPIASALGDRLWLAPSCSLLHVPVDLNLETDMDDVIKSWLSFAVQKLEELRILGNAVNRGRGLLDVSAGLEQNRMALDGRRFSGRVHNQEVKDRLIQVEPSMEERDSPYCKRAARQKDVLKLPAFPTTTIGSFPQTSEIRLIRQKYRKKELSRSEYVKKIRQEIQHVVKVQEDIGLDVLVHGEPERNDMVEYFGEQLNGFVFSRFGWVQSYGSRCVKPPIIYGDVSRPEPMTLEWSLYAQSLTKKPMKGMLTGPVTILNWSFVRDDQPRSQTCRQLALAIRDEVHDLENEGIKIIQIDEAALREGLPLRQSRQKGYLDWAVGSYKLAANGVDDDTQIHTHMCYSNFNDIIEAITRMDADVITIESARSDMKLLDAFQHFDYPNEIGPGVYDIHSPNVPPVDEMVGLLKKAALRIPAKRLWVNPDCGLKTRGWNETNKALRNMVEAAVQLR